MLTASAITGQRQRAHSPGVRLRPFLDRLKQSPERPGLFNPWWQTDPLCDADRDAPSIRRRQLTRFLLEREGARFLLLGEALSYRGGRFTGIPMTSERILLGGLAGRGILPGHILSSVKPRRTSRPDVGGPGFSEPTATIAWREILASGMNPRLFLLWNACPWHPWRPEKGPLSNRTPRREELLAGDRVLVNLLEIFGPLQVLALGRKAWDQSLRLGLQAEQLRHPASGGAAEFRKQFRRLLGS